MKEPKFSDLVKDELKIEELSKLKGGLQLADGCQTGICSKRINPEYCEGGAVCTSGIAGVEVR